MLNRGISGKNDYTVSNRLTKEVISVGMYLFCNVGIANRGINCKLCMAKNKLFHTDRFRTFRDTVLIECFDGEVILLIGGQSF